MCSFVFIIFSLQMSHILLQLLPAVCFCKYKQNTSNNCYQIYTWLFSVFQNIPRVFQKYFWKTVPLSNKNDWKYLNICLWQSYECFVHNNILFNVYDTILMKVLLLSLFQRWRSWGTDISGELCNTRKS